MIRFPHYKGERFVKIADYVRKIRMAFLLVFIAFTTGLIGFVGIEGYNINEAFYMTVITLSTVGFGELHALSPAGRTFVSVLIIFNIGIFTYAISTITSFILEGNLVLLLKDFRVYSKIEKINNHVILCGLGRHGKEVLKELRNQKVPYVIIENDEEKIEELRELPDTLYIDGDATHDEILQEAGIDRASSLIVTLGEDADNVYVVLTARQINPKLTIISRALDTSSESKLKRAGADYVVMPERIGGFYMANLVTKPEAVEFFTLLSNIGDVQIIFDEVLSTNLREQYQGKTIKELNIRGLTGANIIGIHDNKDRYVVNPGPDTLIRSDMRIIVLGDKKQISAFKQLMLKPT